MNKKLILFVTTLSLAAAPMCAFASEYYGPVASIEAVEDRGALRAATGAYRSWKQYNSAWKDMYLGSSSDTMNDSGCLVTAIATLMVHSGSSDEAGVDPGKLCTYLSNNGGFTSRGELYWYKVNGAVDGFRLANEKVLLSGSRYDKMAQIKDYIDRGYYIIVSVGSGEHWVAVDGMTSDGSNIKIFDPAYSYDTLFGSYSDYGIDRIAIFSSTGSGNGNIDVGNTEVESYSAVGKVSVGASYLNVRSDVGTDKGYLTNGGKRVTLQNGEEVTITGKGKDSSGNLWYRVDINGLTGFVYGAYVQIINNGTDNITDPGKPGKVNGEYVNIRTGAGTGYSVVIVANKGKDITVYGEEADSSGNKWYKVKYGSSTGYMLAEYVTLDEDKEEDNTETTYDKEKTGKVNGSSVNARKDAGTGNSVVKTLALNTSLKVVGEKKDSSGVVWYKVKFDGGEGYMHSDYVTIIEEETKEPEDNNTATEKKTGKVNANSVNVRKDAGTGNSVVGNLSSGAAVTIVGEKKDSSGAKWYQIEYTGGKGYMHSDYITVDGVNNNNSNNNNNSSSYEKKAGKVNANSVRVRSDAGTGSSIMGTLSSGAAVTVVGEKKDSSGAKWYQIEYSGGKGYMHSDYITITDGSTDNSGSTNTPTYESKNGKVNDDYVNVRKDAGTSYSAVTSLRINTAVTIVGEKKDSDGVTWYKIQYSNGEGYMRSDFITINGSDNSSNNNSNSGTNTNTGNSGTTSGSTNQDYPMEGIEGKEGVVNHAQVNVRKDANSTADVVVVLKKDVSVLIESATKDSAGTVWYKIGFAGTSGYMMAQYITIQ